METVKLIDTDLRPIDDWVGYLVPYYFCGLPNESARAPYTLEFECGLIWMLGVGQLDQVVWDALMVHEHWCKAPPGRGQAQDPDARIDLKIEVVR
jgi:hypothetical protein